MNKIIIIMINKIIIVITNKMIAMMITKIKSADVPRVSLSRGARGLSNNVMTIIIFRNTFNHTFNHDCAFNSREVVKD